MAVNFNPSCGFVDPSHYEYKKSPFILDESPCEVDLPDWCKVATPPINPQHSLPPHGTVCYMA